MDCQKNIARLQRMKKSQSKIKPLKTGKELGTTYYLGCIVALIILSYKK